MSSPSETSLLASVDAMKTKDSCVYDVTIVCTTDDHQATYWMDLLETGLLSGTNHKVLAVSEDWGGSGAGNGLGTLYAWNKACTLAKTKYDGLDLMKELSDGKISAALFHTAGKGTRMAPLPASENNNKPGVRLPFPLKLADGSIRPLTVLEAVIRQTGIYASSRKGRLSVYWGDQVFLPSASFTYKPTHHVDILCTLVGDTAPTAEEWSKQGLEKYGVIAVMNDGNASQVEKVTHATAMDMLSSLGELKQVGPSLGSFSMSAAILGALCTEYSKELTDKIDKYDTDPHFWMPLTLPLDSYVKLMKQKGTDEDVSKKHHERMTKMKTTFFDTTTTTDDASSKGGMGLFGAVDVGKDACWWDYGQLKLYAMNSKVLLEDSFSSSLLKKFLDIDDTKSKHMDSTIKDDAKIDTNSYLFCSSVGKGTNITSSLIAGVKAECIEANEAIIVNCVAKKIKATKGAILYNLVDDTDEGIVATEDGTVHVAVNDPNGNAMSLKSNMDIDGGKNWKIQLDLNKTIGLTFEDVHKKNKDADIGTIARKRKANYDAAVLKLNL